MLPTTSIFQLGADRSYSIIDIKNDNDFHFPTNWDPILSMINTCEPVLSLESRVIASGYQISIIYSSSFTPYLK